MRRLVDRPAFAYVTGSSGRVTRGLPVGMPRGPRAGTHDTRSAVLGNLRGLVVDTHGADDEPLRRWTDVVERIARDQRERPPRRRVEDGHVLRVDDPGPFNAVYLLPSKRFELDGITGRDVFQTSEEPIPVPGDSWLPSVPGNAVSSM